MTLYEFQAPFLCCIVLCSCLDLINVKTTVEPYKMEAMSEEGEEG
jgi:hypothetical protein